MKTKYVSLFKDFILNESKTLEYEITPYIKYPGISFKQNGMNVDIYINDEYVGDFRFSGIENYKERKYVVAEMIDLSLEMKRKGIYSSIIQGAIDFGKETKRADGVISFQFDLDSGDFERSKEANAFWESWVKKGKAHKERYKNEVIYIAT